MPAVLAKMATTQPRSSLPRTVRLPHLGNDCRYHEVREDQQDTDDCYRLDDDHPKGHVKENVPETDVDARKLPPLPG